MALVALALNTESRCGEGRLHNRGCTICSGRKDAAVLRWCGGNLYGMLDFRECCKRLRGELEKGY